MIIGITADGGDQVEFKKMGYCVDFLDNGFVQGGVDLDKFRRKLDTKKPTYAILPDNDELGAYELWSEYPGIQWIYPLHDINRLPAIRGMCNFIGIPHRKAWRNYGFERIFIFVESIVSHLWYLGYWDSIPIHYLKYFRGMDTTMPIMLAVKKHRYWKCPGQHPKAPTGKNRRELVMENMRNFIEYLNRI